jgi:hypothetical protein
MLWITLLQEDMLTKDAFKIKFLYSNLVLSDLKGILKLLFLIKLRATVVKMIQFKKDKSHTVLSKCSPNKLYIALNGLVIFSERNSVYNLKPSLKLKILNTKQKKTILRVLINV